MPHPVTVGVAGVVARAVRTVTNISLLAPGEIDAVVADVPVSTPPMVSCVAVIVIP